MNLFGVFVKRRDWLAEAMGGRIFAFYSAPVSAFWHKAAMTASDERGSTMTTHAAPASRPKGMTDLEWIVAIEEIRQLKARRDRYVDAHDWEGYAALHAPDHVSHHAPDPTIGAAPEPWTTVGQMIDNIKLRMPEGFITAHHSYDPEFCFETPTRARAIWAMTAATATTLASGEAAWGISYGYYYESYEKCDGVWLFTSRRWQRYFGVQSQVGTAEVEVVLPQVPLKGRAAFEDF